MFSKRFSMFLLCLVAFFAGQFDRAQAKPNTPGAPQQTGKASSGSLSFDVPRVNGDWAGEVSAALFMTGWANEEPAVALDGPDVELKEFRLDDLEANLARIEPGLERDYFSGMLANRVGHIAESIQLLSGVVPKLRTSRPDRAALALVTLADDYNKSFQYADEDRAYEDLLNHFSNQLSPDEVRSTKDDAAIAHILRDAPPQTIRWDGSVRLKTERNPLQSMNLELTVNGVQAPWLLDTGANHSVVSKSFAERLGLKFLSGAAEAQGGLTGIENPLRLALLPTLQMGGATLHNVVVLVVDDANLDINLGKYSYQIHGIIGYPVFQALGTITFQRAGEFTAGYRTQVTGEGARIYMKLLTPVIECKVAGKNLPFGFDTGAASSELSVRYYRDFRSESKGWKKDKVKTAGMGGAVIRQIYTQQQLELGIGDKTVTLRNVPISLTGAGTKHDEVYGNLGQDVVANFESFTVDFSTMKFVLGTPAPPDQGPLATPKNK
jgi:Aspartyl protease